MLKFISKLPIFFVHYNRISAIILNMKKIHLIRHGMTYANENKLYCGRTDLALSEKGIEEIRSLKNQGIYPQNPDLFFTSGLVRTIQTLEYIYGTVSHKAISQLAEYNFGQFEMKSYEELKHEPSYQAWISDEEGTVSCPDGENKQQFMKRVLLGYNLLLKESESALLVSHGGVIASIMDYLFPNTYHFYEWQPKPGRGYTIMCDKKIKTHTSI